MSTHGDTDIGSCQCGCIIDAITNHYNRTAIFRNVF